jgi:hypothetical protein
MRARRSGRSCAILVLLPGLGRTAGSARSILCTAIYREYNQKTELSTGLQNWAGLLIILGRLVEAERRSGGQGTGIRLECTLLLGEPVDQHVDEHTNLRA